VRNVIESALDKAVTLARPFEAAVLDPRAAMTRRQADISLNLLLGGVVPQESVV
jgi:hypothetical protein